MEKVKYLIASLIIFLFSNIYSQEGWFWQNPLPQGNDLYDVCQNELNGTYYTCGAYGTILMQSTGNIWTPLNASTKEILHSICFKGTHGWIVGYNGTIMHSSDGAGVAWFPQESGTDKYLKSVFFLDEQNGWAVGVERTILHTSDGGQNWEVQSTGGSTHFESVFFVDESTGYVCGRGSGGGTILKTTNGGSFWQGQNTPTFNRLRSIHFKDINNGVAVGDKGTVLYTTDAGLNWILADSLTESDLMDAYFNNDGIGYAVGNDGAIAHTNDFGRNWDVKYSDTENILYGISGNKIVGQAGIIMRSISGEQSWEFESSGFYDNLSGIDFADENNGWVVGAEGKILHTTDGGMTWDSIPNGATESLLTVEFINADTGWVAGRDHDLSTPFANNLIQRTTDGGLNWEFQYLPGGNDMMVMDVDFIDGAPGEPMRGFCTGGLSHTWRTEDYGETWEALRGGCGEGNFNSCCFVDENTGWFVGTPSNVGTGYSIMRTTDGGETFEEQTNPTDIMLRSVCFVDNQKGLAVGSNGTIIYTSDGGANWEVSPDGGYTSWNSVSLTETGKAWAVDTKGGIAYSSDWGHTWEDQESVTSQPLWEVFFINDNEGWVVGGLGSSVILHTTNGGVTTNIGKENKSIIEEFNLEQNYPNPFNPTTTIRYSIPNVETHGHASVQIKIYDVLGREITTLVNKQQKPGYYEVNYNASNLTSGVYFYQLRTGSFIESKKMLLIK